MKCNESTCDISQCRLTRLVNQWALVQFVFILTYRLDMLVDFFPTSCPKTQLQREILVGQFGWIQNSARIWNFVQQQFGFKSCKVICCRVVIGRCIPVEQGQGDSFAQEVPCQKGVHQLRVQFGLCLISVQGMGRCDIIILKSLALVSKCALLFLAEITHIQDFSSL